jgi:hypothetical protein
MVMRKSRQVGIVYNHYRSYCGNNDFRRLAGAWPQAQAKSTNRGCNCL